MRRTGNTSVSPTIGIVLTLTGKMDFGPACAAAGPAWVAAPASASAPVARMVLRSTVSMRVLLVCFCYSTAYLAPSVTPGKQFRIEHASTSLLQCSEILPLRNKKPARARAFAFGLGIEGQCLISGGSLPPFA